MKDLFLLLLLTSLAASSFGQNRLKGPQAKNYHPIHKKYTSVSVASQNTKSISGPRAKNRKINTANTKLETPSKTSLKGPRAKNRQVLKPTAPPSMAINQVIEALPGLLFGRPY